MASGKCATPLSPRWIAAVLRARTQPSLAWSLSPLSLIRIVLASGSPSRLALLRAAGVEPDVIISGVDEEAIAASLGPDPRPTEVVIALARAKAYAVVEELLSTTTRDTVVIAADSVFFLDGVIYGKPHTPEVAWERWQQMSGRQGTLLTGHCVVRLSQGQILGDAYEVGTALLNFGDLTGENARAYLDTGEPLEVAGAFTLEGRGSWFIDRVEGDPSTIIGLGLPVLRDLLSRLGLSIRDVWNSAGMSSH